MYFRQIRDAATNALTYLLADEERREAVVIDPLRIQATLILALLAERGVRLRHVLRTHVHQPARAECGKLCPSTGATLMLGHGSPEDIGGERVEDGALIHCGAEVLSVIATPGHAPGSVCYLWQDRLFCGDTLLIRGSDCVGLDADPGLLFDSVKQKLFVLPDETLVFPGHDASGRTVSTIGEERRYNADFAQSSREDFVAAAIKACEPPVLRTKGSRISHGLGAW
ncbi:MAG: hypothetical protein RJA63_283 [Pseudomonadota bacterium]|jgi:glyoxylase-like metal-dependent hydrolase (beta-lactamase superfamily II)